MFGRYEFHGQTENGNRSEKFWEIKDLGDGTCVATWGKIGTTGRETVYPYDEALRKISEKISKGYEIQEPEPKKRKNKGFHRKPIEKVAVTQKTPFLEAMEKWCKGEEK